MPGGLHRALLALLVAAVLPGYVAAEHRAPASAHKHRQAHARWQNDQARAGYPQQVAWYAKRSETRHHSYGWVGGGVLVGGGDAPYRHDGTWGRDYHVFSLESVWLGWSHGRHYEGGTGTYKTDGPKLHLHKK